ncbi:MAG: hypothetical protein FJ037_04255 [Chloroflexi bacterium]|nr:hypothetical protein [Chloroflexota bacterium]
MRVSGYFNLARTQPELDFVDVDVATDIPVFVDHRALLLLDSDWSDECQHLIQNFFHEVLAAAKNRNRSRGLQLLTVLREPNETHLGFSHGRPRGRGLGPESAKDIWEALARSQAVASGLLQDLEDTILTTEGVGPDLISDIATKVIRAPLLRYTQSMAEYYGIALTKGVNSGAVWNPVTTTWDAFFTEMPIVDGAPLLLVPKSIVRRRMDFDLDEYYDHYLLEELQQLELADPASGLVTVLKKGRRVVYKKDLVSRYGRGKHAVVELTLQHPSVLTRYRAAKARPRPAIDSLSFAEISGTPAPQWDDLLADIKKIPPGADGATEFHRAVERLISTVFSSVLTFPQIERHIHGGRKRIDISYTNVAGRGFFAWLRANHPASNIFVECKNYSSDPKNPELDQIAGRFSPSRGKFGIVVCRKVEDREKVTAICRDHAQDDHGFILVLDDDDLATLVESARSGTDSFQWLKSRFDELVM